MFNKKRILGFVGITIAAALVAAGIVQTPAGGATPAVAAWSLAGDYGGEPSPANPKADSYGNAGVWAYMGGTPHSSAGYTLMTTYSPAQCVSQLVDTWSEPAGVPYVTKNRGGATSCGDIPFVAGSAAVHPAAGRAAIVRWTSPVAGTIGVSGAATDSDSGGGDGVNWSIDKGDTVIASGGLSNGGSQNFASGTGGAALAAIPVEVGDAIYLVVSAGGTFLFDTTQVALTIAWEAPATTTTTAPTTTTTAVTTTTTAAPTTTTSTTLGAPPLSRAQQAVCQALNSVRNAVGNSPGRLRGIVLGVLNIVLSTSGCPVPTSSIGALTAKPSCDDLLAARGGLANARSELKRLVMPRTERAALDRNITSVSTHLERTIRDRRCTSPARFRAQSVEAAAPTSDTAAPTSDTTPTTYTVARGDSLWSIAQRTLGDGNAYTTLLAINRGTVRSPSLIYPGQVLLLPT